MKPSPAVVLTCLLGAGLTLVQPFGLPATSPKVSPRPPRLIGCVFIFRGNVTCRWEPGDGRATHYTLHVQRTPGLCARHRACPVTFTCTTSGTSCSAGIGNSTVRINFCIRVTAHSGNRNISSELRCQPGRKEVILPPVILKSVDPVRGSPECLKVEWRRILSEFPVSDSEIRDGHLNAQIDFAVQEPGGRYKTQVSNVTATGERIRVCLFKPDTSYSIRLRTRYQGPASPWSPWSRPLHGRTTEDAPSAAPVFWMRVKQTERNGWRLVSLLWKPLPHFQANGRVLFYNVTCETGSVYLSDGSCRDLRHPRFSCSLLVPSDRCSCALTASTSAGTSPESRMWLLSTSDTGPPPPKQITARPLNDSSLEVGWTSSLNSSVSSFVVEWFAVREQSSSTLHWEKLNSSSTNLVITEGVRPMERYDVSVRSLYGEGGAGENRTLHIYTQQGKPSAGPNVMVQNISGSTVVVGWSPVPVELLNGFLCNYTLFYRATNHTARNVSVPGYVHHYTLENLLPGNYEIFMWAHTVAGSGPAGNMANLHIGSEEISIVVSVIIPFALTSLALILMACMVQMKMGKGKLCQGVPNPSKSSLSGWIPENNLESKELFMVQEKPDIKYTDVVLLDKVKDLDLVDSYQSVRKLHAHSLQQFSSPPDQIPGKASTRSMLEAKTTSYTDLSPSSCFYSNILHSQVLKNLPTPLLPSSKNQSSDCQPKTVCFSDMTLHLDGGKQSSDFRLSDEKKDFCHFLKQNQSCVSVSGFSLASPCSALVSQQTEDCRADLVQSLQTDTSRHLHPLPDSFMMSLSHTPIFVDLSYCSVQCDPHISSGV
ncbi:unnamed protein product [Menidia menidia]|uniref:(Atlantic silverside) hypothetical protein n=1 Tax=Menidia menidia TaxID=238744 RepID=A0A8S4AJJ9_9TELE|nr:unnamed protein product [Menidia menidia]